MKLLINGYTVSEHIQLKRNYSDADISLVEKMIEHIKTNKVMYSKLVLMTALLLHYNVNFVFASDFATSLDSVGYQIVGMLMGFAKWSCIAMGTKNMVTTMIDGGNMKQAMTEGIQYWIGFLFIQFYPQLFDLFSGIKF
ncbi:MAG: hypothetical protein RR657_07100 [Peptostreptococcaceae bacterium]